MLITSGGRFYVCACVRAQVHMHWCVYVWKLEASGQPSVGLRGKQVPPHQPFFVGFRDQTGLIFVLAVQHFMD